MRIVLAGVVAVVAALLLASTALAETAEERRLQEARAKLDQVRDQVDSAESEAEGRRAELADAEAQVADIMEAVHAAEMAVQRQEETVRNARERLDELQAAANQRVQEMSVRAAEMYRQGTSVPMSVVLDSETADEAVTRSAYLEIMQRADLAGFEELEADHVALDAQKEVLEAEEAALQRVLEEQEEILAEARELRDHKALAAAEAAEELADLEAQERHLESESRELAALARRASEEAAAARAQEQAAAEQASGDGGDGGDGGDSQASGGANGSSTPAGDSASGWQWPASGPVTSEYGMRWGRLHEGIDIGGSSGAAIVAARPGTVTNVGRMGGYGNMVMIDHGGGVVTAYAHLSSMEVSPGQSVSGGQRIGGMGCTGSCTGTHLHFEVRVNGSARNPREFLP